MKAGGCVQVEPNPQPRADLTGGGVRIGHDSAAEVLQDVRGPPGPLCTGRAAEVLRAACGPPGPLLGPSELGAVLASIANGCPFAKYPGPLPGCCFLFLGFAVR